MRCGAVVDTMQFRLFLLRILKNAWLQVVLPNTAVGASNKSCTDRLEHHQTGIAFVTVSIHYTRLPVCTEGFPAEDLVAVTQP